MPDITLCVSKRCPLKSLCHRALATPSGDRQSYADFFFTLPCKHYWPVEELVEGPTEGVPGEITEE